jgi:hypothetical protein
MSDPLGHTPLTQRAKAATAMTAIVVHTVIDRRNSSGDGSMSLRMAFGSGCRIPATGPTLAMW